MNIKRQNSKLLFFALLGIALSGSAVAEGTVRWNVPVQPSTDSLDKSVPADVPLVNTNRETVAFSYAIDRDQPLAVNTPVHTEKSRQYWLDTTGEKLAAGLELPVTGGQTIVRISPLKTDKSITAAGIQLMAKGRHRDLDVFADATSLKDTGVPFSPNSVAFKTRLPAGKAVLKVTGLRNDTPVVVHVFEPESSHVLALQTVKATFGAGEPVQVLASLTNGVQSEQAEIQGYVSLPDGRVAGSLRFVRRPDGTYRADLPIHTLTGLGNGLWEVHVFAANDKTMRDAQTAFAVTLPTAAFDGRLELDSGAAGGAVVKVGIQVAQEGRFEVRGVLYGRNSSGQAVPFAVSMAASWLSPGQRSVALPVDGRLIAQAGLQSPFEIRQVTLTDQSRFAPVQMVAEGITLFEVPKPVDGDMR